MNTHLVNVLFAFGVAYISSAVFYLSRRFGGIWALLAVAFIVAGFIALGQTITSAGTGDSHWDWWILLGWVCGWVAWWGTKQELGLAKPRRWK